MTGNEAMVYIVDDDDDVRTALSRSLRKRGMQVEAFADAQSFLDAFDRDIQSCLVLDYGLPGMDGLQLQQQLIEEEAAIPIIFITGHGGIPESVRATQAGAVDFLEKPFSLQLLIERIGAALELSKRLHEDQRQRESLDVKLATLTSREAETLEHILANPSQVSSKEIALALGISPRTADIHRARIMQKMDVKNLLELVHTCMNR